jgi:chromate transporter
MHSTDSKKIFSELYDPHETNVVENYDEKKLITNSQMFSELFFIGANCFGGYSKKNDLIEKKIVNDKRFLTKKSFKMILTLSEHIPGPTSTQLIISLSAIKTTSLIGTFLGMIGYILPGFILSLIISSLIYYLRGYLQFNYDTSAATPLLTISPDNYLQYYLQVIITGMNQGSLAILLLTGLDFSRQFSKSIYHLSIIFFSALSYYFFNSFPLMLLIMLLCGLFSLFNRDQDYIIGIEDFTVELDGIPFLGTQCLIVYLLVYILLLLLILYFDIYSINFYLMERFFRMGSIVIGGGASVFPFIIAEFSLVGLISELDVLSGFSIVSLLPGPVFNIACIIGTLINGPIAGFLCTFVVFLPGALFILWSLPFVNSFTQMYSIQRFLCGINCALIGFIFTACFKMWIISCFYNPFTNWIIGSLNFLLAAILIAVFKIIEPFALIIASVLHLCVKILLKI